MNTSSARLSILVPTAGTGDLSYLFHSIKTQELIEGDEILIIGDGPQDSTKRLIDAVGDPFRYVQGPATGDWGHAQLNFAQDIARGDFLNPTDDDDVFLPRA